MKPKFENLCSDDIVSASMFVNSVFLDSVAPKLTQEGIDTFQSAMTPEAFAKRLETGNKFIVCKQSSLIIGLGEMRNQNHLNLLFVKPSMQGQGIGRRLFTLLVRDILDNTVTVNASLNSVGAYKEWGFKNTSNISEVQGIRSQAMAYDCSKKQFNDDFSY